MSMATDGFNTQNPALGWPGDLKETGHIATLADYVNVLVRNDYLNSGDLRIFSGFGYKAYAGTLRSGSNGVLVPAFTDENCALKVYLVKKDDLADTVFLASKNYTYNYPLNNDAKSKLFEQKFVVLRKGGDASILKKSQAQSLQLVGKLPGGGMVENAENCLSPGAPAP